MQKVELQFRHSFWLDIGVDLHKSPFYLCVGVHLKNVDNNTCKLYIQGVHCDMK